MPGQIACPGIFCAQGVGMPGGPVCYPWKNEVSTPEAAEQRGAMKFGKGLMARLIWYCPAKRTKKLPEAGKNPPKNFKKGLDTHGAVLYDNGAS